MVFEPLSGEGYTPKKKVTPGKNHRRVSYGSKYGEALDVIHTIEPVGVDK